MSRVACIVCCVRLLDSRMTSCLDPHPLFRRLGTDEMAADVCTEQIHITTEEGKKVARNYGDKFAAVYERIPSP